MTNDTTTHTPGPWTVRLSELFDGHYIVSEVEDRSPDEDEDYANARLIAAAPDLLAAAKFAADALDDHVGDAVRRSVYTLLDAIAKAEGRDA